MNIDDNNGLYIGGTKKPNRVRLWTDPAGVQHVIPASIQPDELLDDDDKMQGEIRAFAVACLKTCDVAVIGLDRKKYRIIGAKHLFCKQVTPATVRRAARLAVQAGWREASLAVPSDLSKECSDAAHISFDVCLLKVSLLVVN